MPGMYMFGVRAFNDEPKPTKLTPRDFTFTHRLPTLHDSCHQLRILEKEARTPSATSKAVSPTCPGRPSSNEVLPAEILTEIFTLCLTELPEEHNSLDTTCCPWNLGQVCHSWRVIVTRHAPHLWTHLYLDLEGMGYDPPRVCRQQQILQEAITRGHDRPLDLEINARDCHMLAYDCVLWALLRHAHRWRCVDIMLPDCTGPWDMISVTFPLLEWFSVEGSEASESGGGRIDLTAAPKLVGLRIEMLPIGMDLRVPWEQLRTFEDSDSYASYEPLFVRLSRCRDLEELTIIADKAFFEDTPPPFTYTLPNLRKLDVSATLDEDFPCGILSALTAPRLESLAVTYWTEEQLQDFITETIKLLKRSSVPTLTSLDLSGPPAVAFSDDRMRVFLRDIPKLTSFTATGTFDKDFFDLLIEPKSEGLREFKFLPHLTELTLHAAEESNDAGIMDLLWARSLRPTTPRQNRLKSIEIWYVDKAWYDDDRVVLDERSQLVIACKGGELCYSSWCPFVL